METKINIAEILKDKPEETKLYADAFGELSIKNIDVESEPSITLLDKSGYMPYFYSNGKYSLYGEPILFPSKEMRDWSKFIWKKGDVLVSNDGDRHIIFNSFSSVNYTAFEGKHWISVSKRRHVSCLNMQSTQDYHVEDNKDTAQTYINAIEKRLGGKLNLETLEIEKSAFKDGDILCVIDNSNDYHYILIYKGQDDKHIHRYVTMFEDNSLNIKKDSYLTKPEDYSTHYATEEEKQQLFDALAKEGKAWDAEKKQIVDLKSKIELKPFDKVLVRDHLSDNWRANLFSHIDKNGCHHCVWASWNYCIPYKDNEHLLGTTNDPK